MSMNHADLNDIDQSIWKIYGFEISNIFLTTLLFIILVVQNKNNEECQF